jgi:hypothetical protein
LTREKLAAATALVEEQLKEGHIEPTHSPWNTPILGLRKKLGKWRLLQDLRTVNRVMQPMGVLQPGLPSPTAIPLDYCLCILDLKDAFFVFCFFAIPLHPKDRENLLSLYHYQIIKVLGLISLDSDAPRYG